MDQEECKMKNVECRMVALDKRAFLCYPTPIQNRRFFVPCAGLYALFNISRHKER